MDTRSCQLCPKQDRKFRSATGKAPVIGLHTKSVIRITCLATSGCRSSVEKPIKTLNKLPRDFIVSVSLHDEGEFIFLSSAYLVRWQSVLSKPLWRKTRGLRTTRYPNFTAPSHSLSVIRNNKLTI